MTTINIEGQVKISESKGLSDGVDICRDIMERLARVGDDVSTNGTLFYYIPLAVQYEIDKSHA